MALVTTNAAPYINTPWGKTTAWMCPREPHPVYSQVNPWALISDKPLLPKPVWRSDATPNEYNPPPYGKTVSVPILVSPNLMGYVVGSNGSVFKAITHQVRGATYIWYHQHKQMIELWASTDSALEKMQKRVVDHMLKIQQQKMKTNVDDAWANITEDEE